jgi:DNA-binding CsgD family transcriptional regulator
MLKVLTTWRRDEVSPMRTEINADAYVEDLENHLRLTLFGGGTADPEGAVLLVRGALAGGDRLKAAELACQTQRLAAGTLGDRDMSAAAEHARGLVEEDAAALEHAAGRYADPGGQASALEDAGNARAARGEQDQATTLLGQAHALYTELGSARGTARVRSGLRELGVRLRHWTTQAGRPSFGWGSLTDTERRIADLAAQGLSNRQVAARMFLSTHTVAFHLRHVFWKLGVTSRVQLARLAAEQASG